MNDITIYLIGLTLTSLISLSIFFIFKPYLKRIITELNGNKEDPAKFWVVYSGIILFIVPLIFSMSIIPDNEYRNSFFQISRQIKWSLIGITISFFAFGIAIIRFVPKK